MTANIGRSLPLFSPLIGYRARRARRYVFVWMFIPLFLQISIRPPHKSTHTEKEAVCMSSVLYCTNNRFCLSEMKPVTININHAAMTRKDGKDGRRKKRAVRITQIAINGDAETVACTACWFSPFLLSISITSYFPLLLLFAHLRRHIFWHRHILESLSERRAVSTFEAMPSLSHSWLIPACLY